MANGVYVAVSGSITQQHALEVVANNLAHARTAGFKRDAVTFHEVVADHPHLPPTSPAHDKDFAQTVGTHARLEAGPIDRTGNPLDVAIEGDGYLRVETARGERLTRNGRLHRSVDGFLGHSGWVQLPALVAVGVLAASALVTSRSPAPEHR